MATIILRNGDTCKIKEDAEEVTQKIWDGREDGVLLTLILNPMSSDRKEVKARFIIAAIAYWY